MANVFSTFNAEVEKRHQEMISDLEGISVDNLKSEGVSLTIGGKVFKFTDLEVTSNDDVEEKLRKEFKEKLNSQQQRIREKINNKINQLLALHKQKQQELDRKEAQMKRKYAEAAMMPEIKQRHILKGLSVAKGATNDELVWLYRAVYNPRFIVYYDDRGGYSNRQKHRKIVPDRLLNRMKKSIIIVVKTKKSTITDITTREIVPNATGELPVFEHYHQRSHGGGDCWGNWKPSKSWSEPDDIMNIAKEAEAVLETINQGSIAIRGPAGLPKLQTILNAVQRAPEASEATRTAENNNDEDVWST